MSVPEEVAEAASAEHLDDASIEVISPLGARKGRQIVYLARAGGREAIKLRLLETPEAAAKLERLSSDLGPPFAAVIRSHGRVVVEPWIDGEQLSVRTANAWIETAGGILGGLHSRGLDRDLLDGCSVTQWLRSARIDLETILAAGLIEAGVAARLGKTIASLEGRPTRMGLVHRDFCPENLILGPDADLWVIDNEWMCVGPIAFDLGRTFHRWPMEPEAWDRFLAAYVNVAGEPHDLEPWMQVAGLFAARVAHQIVPSQLDRSLTMLGPSGP